MFRRMFRSEIVRLGALALIGWAGIVALRCWYLYETMPGPYTGLKEKAAMAEVLDALPIALGIVLATIAARAFVRWKSASRGRGRELER